MLGPFEVWNFSDCSRGMYIINTHELFHVSCRIRFVIAQTTNTITEEKEKKKELIDIYFGGDQLVFVTQ